MLLTYFLNDYEMMVPLCYKLEGRGSIPDGVIRMFHWHNPSSCTMALRSTQTLKEMSTRNISLGEGGGEDGRRTGLTTLPFSCANCLEIWEPQPPGTFTACPVLYGDCFTLSFAFWDGSSCCIITGITFVFTHHTHYISVVRSYILKSSQLLSPEIGTSINRQTGLSVNRYYNLLSRIMMSSLCYGWFYQFLLIDFIICLPYLYDLLVLILVHVHANAPCLILLISLDMVKCSWVHSIMFLYVLFFCQ